MIKQVLAGITVSLMSGTGLAQTYFSVSPPPAAFAPPSIFAPQTTATSHSASDQRGVKIQKAVDRKSNAAVEKDLVAGSP